MPESTIALALFSFAGSIVNSVANRPSAPKPSAAVAPEVPQRTDAAIEGARRGVVESGFGRGRQRTLIAGAAGGGELPASGVQTQTLLGG